MSNQLPTMEIDRSPTGADTGLSATGLQRIRDELDNEVAAANLPGAVVMLVCNDRPAFAYATGYLDPVARTPMCLDALFRIYAMTKPLTSVAAMMLVEQGVLALGDRIADYLPEMRGARGETLTRWRFTTIPAPSRPTVATALRCMTNCWQKVCD